MLKRLSPWGWLILWRFGKQSNSWKIYMHSCIHSFIHACIHSCMHDACMNAYMHECIHAWMHSFIHAFIHAFIYAFIHSCIHSCIQALNGVYWSSFRESRTDGPWNDSEIWQWNQYTPYLLTLCTGLNEMCRRFNEKERFPCARIWQPCGHIYRDRWRQLQYTLYWIGP